MLNFLYIRIENYLFNRAIVVLCQKNLFLNQYYFKIVHILYKQMFKNLEIDFFCPPFSLFLNFSCKNEYWKLNHFLIILPTY